MAIDLTVPMGEKLDLGGTVSPAVAACLHTLKITKFTDLVHHGFIESQETLRQLLTAAQDATRAALNEGGPFRRIPGDARRYDLGRYGRFIAAVPGVQPRQSQRFWSIARNLEPTALIGRVDLDTLFVRLALRQVCIFHVFRFKDVTIEQGATLVINKQDLHCGHLLIKKTGKIVVAGAGVYIRASSVKGDQNLNL